MRFSLLYTSSRATFDSMSVDIDYAVYWSEMAGRYYSLSLKEFYRCLKNNMPIIVLKTKKEKKEVELKGRIDESQIDLIINPCNIVYAAIRE